MKFLSLLKRVRSKIRNQGFKNTVTDFITLLYDHYFDFKYKIDTASWYSISEMAKENEVAKHAVLYQGTKILPLKKLLKKLNIQEDQVFVDIGSGKGRVLLLASELGLKNVRGIEFSGFLCLVAKENIKKYKKRNTPNTSFEIINMDASQYQFKGDENVFFMYNPFDEYILERVLNNILNSIKKNNREVLIIYVNPAYRGFLEKTVKPKKITNYNYWNVEIVVYNI